MMTNINWTYCSDHFAAYTSIKTLCCISEVNKILYQLYITIKNFKYTVQWSLVHSTEQCNHHHNKF